MVVVGVVAGEFQFSEAEYAAILAVENWQKTLEVPVDVLVETDLDCRVVLGTQCDLRDEAIVSCKAEAKHCR